MRIAVIGMGNAGGVLGRKFVEVGHNVCFCVRDPDDPKKRQQAEDAKASIGAMSAAQERQPAVTRVFFATLPEQTPSQPLRLSRRTA